MRVFHSFQKNKKKKNTHILFRNPYTRKMNANKHIMLKLNIYPNAE